MRIAKLKYKLYNTYIIEKSNTITGEKTTIEFENLVVNQWLNRMLQGFNAQNTAVEIDQIRVGNGTSSDSDTVRKQRTTLYSQILSRPATADITEFENGNNSVTYSAVIGAGTWSVPTEITEVSLWLSNGYMGTHAWVTDSFGNKITLTVYPIEELTIKVIVNLIDETEEQLDVFVPIREKPQVGNRAKEASKFHFNAIESQMLGIGGTFSESPYGVPTIRYFLSGLKNPELDPFSISGFYTSEDMRTNLNTSEPDNPAIKFISTVLNTQGNLPNNEPYVVKSVPLGWRGPGTSRESYNFGYIPQTNLNTVLPDVILTADGVQTDYNIPVPLVSEVLGEQIERKNPDGTIAEIVTTGVYVDDVLQTRNESSNPAPNTYSFCGRNYEFWQAYESTDDDYLLPCGIYTALNCSNPFPPFNNRQSLQNQLARFNFGVLSFDSQNPLIFDIPVPVNAFRGRTSANNTYLYLDRFNLPKSQYDDSSAADENNWTRVSTLNSTTEITNEFSEELPGIYRITSSSATSLQNHYAMFGYKRPSLKFTTPPPNGSQVKVICKSNYAIKTAQSMFLDMELMLSFVRG